MNIRSYFTRFVLIAFTLGLAICYVGEIDVLAKTKSYSWQQVNVNGFGDVNNGSGIPFTYKNSLYTTTFNSSTGAEIFRYEDNGI